MHHHRGRERHGPRGVRDVRARGGESRGVGSGGGDRRGDGGAACGRQAATQLFFACDVSDEASVRAAVAATVARYGGVDVLYNNAGIMPEADHSVLDTSVEVWDRVMAVNVRGIFLGCKYAIPEMLKGGGGSIINIASFVALVGCSVPQDAYTASKGALISLTKSLAIQFRPQGIRTNAICPGPIETPLMTEWLLKDDAAKQLRLNRQPSGRRPPRRHRQLCPLSRLRRIRLDERRGARRGRWDHEQLLLVARSR